MSMLAPLLRRIGTPVEGHLWVLFLGRQAVRHLAAKIGVYGAAQDGYRPDHIGSGFGSRARSSLPLPCRVPS